MANERMRKGLGRAGERLMANKNVFDRNVETVLDFVNIPSKRDVRELKSRLDTLSSQLVNLSMKIDRMMAAGEMPAPRQARPASAEVRAAPAQRPRQLRLTWQAHRSARGQARSAPVMNRRRFASLIGSSDSDRAGG